MSDLRLGLKLLFGCVFTFEFTGLTRWLELFRRCPESGAIYLAKTGRLPSRAGEPTLQPPVYRYYYEKERRGKAFRCTFSDETIVAYANF